MLRQTITGLRSKTLSFTAGSDEDALAPLLAGKVEKYSLKNTVGTNNVATPLEANRKNLIVGSNGATGRISCMVRLPHVKADKFFNDISAASKGKFDSHWDSSVKCDYVKLHFDKIL